MVRSGFVGRPGNVAVRADQQRLHRKAGGGADDEIDAIPPFLSDGANGSVCGEVQQHGPRFVQQVEDAGFPSIHGEQEIRHHPATHRVGVTDIVPDIRSRQEIGEMCDILGLLQEFAEQGYECRHLRPRAQESGLRQRLHHDALPRHQNRVSTV